MQWLRSTALESEILGGEQQGDMKQFQCQISGKVQEK